MATLINVATPGPPLTDVVSSNTHAILSGSVQGWCTSVNPTINICTAITSITLGAGTWVLLGLAFSGASSGTFISYLSTTSASASNDFPSLVGGTGLGAAPPYMVFSIAKLAGSTTIYLNVTESVSNSTQATIYAVQIA